MGKVLFVLDLPEPALRKTKAPPVRPHKDKKLYSRKEKHKKSSANTGDFCFCECRFFFYNGIISLMCYVKLLVRIFSKA